MVGWGFFGENKESMGGDIPSIQGGDFFVAQLGVTWVSEHRNGALLFIFGNRKAVWVPLPRIGKGSDLPLLQTP